MDKYSHHAHILPLKLYLAVGVALIVMTVITVTVAQIQLGALNLIVALGIATFKAILVGLFFMHLKYDNKIFGVVFISALAFLGIFITITMLDTLRRGDIYTDVGTTIKPNAIIYDQPAKAAPPGGEHGAAAGHGEEKKEH